MRVTEPSPYMPSVTHSLAHTRPDVFGQRGGSSTTTTQFGSPSQTTRREGLPIQIPHKKIHDGQAKTLFSPRGAASLDLEQPALLVQSWSHLLEQTSHPGRRSPSKDHGTPLLWNLRFSVPACNLF
ncbi:hypothetical protein PG996_011849 [Apiospora saccharicola]|uniref:Uncharacterized protein n=1 Tax=Apiospora saccharicola TaxID=335842 RepID=A0ABR1UG92_9PEZI